MNANVERTTIRKVYLRLLPLLFVSYFVCYLDRINVGFAALTGSFEAGLFFLSGCALVSAIVTLVAVRERRSLVEPTGVGMTPA
jgi:hypothetical protein